ECEYPVPALAVPDLRQLPPVAALAEVEAVALFCQRARAAAFGFALTPANAAAVAAVCARLDGLPLALELAAARSKQFSPEGMQAQLERQWQLLVGGPRDRLERQRSLRGAIDWSYYLLTAPEQALYRQLAVFVGGADADAIAAVVEDAEPDLRARL